MIHFITLCDKDSYDRKRAQILERSFAKYGGDHVLHVIQDYILSQGKYNKIIQIYHYLRNHKEIADDDVILFIDAFDTIVMKPLDGLETDFRKSDQHLIFGAHHEFKYIYDDARKYYDMRYGIQEKHRYLASNFFVGYKWSILQFFQYMMEKLEYYPKPDKKIHDQRVIGYVFYQKDAKEYSSINKRLSHLRLNIDTSLKFVYTKSEKSSIYEILGINPYFLHIPHLDKVEQKRDYLLIAKYKDLI